MTAARTPRLTGGHVLALFVGFFAVVLAADGVMVALAYSTFPGATAVTPYEDGLAYNRALAQSRAQAALGWRLTAQADPGQVRVSVVDRAGAPASGLAVTVRLQRPATDAGALQLRLAETAPGAYGARTAALHGAWDLEVTAAGLGGRAMARRRVWLP